jgi:NAD(P)-dependent dehydrogenase (short-subunit alcohol dehydrogenase family)
MMFTLLGEMRATRSQRAGAIMPLAEADAQRISDIFAVNVLGPSLLAKEALPYLKESKGSIVTLSSTYGRKPGASLSHYGASKAALEYLTRAWALELAPMGTRVNALVVGPTESGALTGMMGLTEGQAKPVKQQEREQVPIVVVVSLTKWLAGPSHLQFRAASGLQDKSSASTVDSG